MLLFTAMWWVVAVAAAASAARDSALPVYFANVDVQPAGLDVLESGAAAAVLSHFRGDGLAAFADGAAAALRGVPSPFLDERNTAVVLVEGLDAGAAEPLLGSPHLLLDAEAAPLLAPSAPRQPVTVLSGIDALDHPVIRVRADLDSVLAELKSVKLSKVMLIGVAGSKSAAPRSGAWHALRADAAPEKNTTSYVKIPAFFDSEESCEDVTRSCSGRGACSRRSNGKYACRCEPTKKDGYTYYWGGSDCSKRDVSFQANLLVGTTVAIIVASALSVGLLFRLGSEPLPGILTTSGFEG